MKITFDTDGADPLLARMYMASVVGPFRRPNGRGNVVFCPVGVGTELVQNRTADRVLAVTVAEAAGQGPVVVMITQSNGVPFSALFSTAAGFSDHFFVLKPGESLTANPLVTAITLDVFTDTF